MSKVADKPVPSGVVMICVNDQGREIATAHDFEQFGYGGFKLQRSQEIRCETALARAVICAYASPILAECIEDYDRKKILRALLDKGHKVHTIFLPEALQDDD